MGERGGGGGDTGPVGATDCSALSINAFWLGTESHFHMGGVYHIR